jgi:hypothetical protein
LREKRSSWLPPALPRHSLTAKRIYDYCPTPPTAGDVQCRLPTLPAPWPCIIVSSIGCRGSRMDWKTLAASTVAAALVSSIIAFIGSVLTAASTERRLRREYQIEFAAERVARELLMDPRWRLRSIEVLNHHLSGFTADDLRKVLVRAGAIRFNSPEGKEIWGLLDRNRDRLGVRDAHFSGDWRTVETEDGFERIPQG